jgi:hypothetical protein
VASQSRKGNAGQSGDLKFHLVNETPAPILTALDGPHDGVIGRVKVFGGVAVLGGIATAHMAANHAHSEMHPGIVHLKAFLATPGVGFYVLDLVHMRTVHEFLFLARLRNR